MTSSATWKVLAVLAATGISGIVACSSDEATTTGTLSTSAAVTGAADTHCGSTVVTVEQAACTAPAEEEDEADAGTDAGHADDATTSEYGETMFNAEGNDDDCKYRVSWQSTAVVENKDVSFVVKATSLGDNAPVTGANVRAEVFLSDVHPAPNSGVTTKESPNGTYTIGPIHFDAPGRWTVRFHFFESCNDNEHSPHGHAAFLVDVP